jgi:hypothetical protein
MTYDVPVRSLPRRVQRQLRNLGYTKFSVICKADDTTQVGAYGGHPVVVFLAQADLEPHVPPELSEAEAKALQIRMDEPSQRWARAFEAAGLGPYDWGNPTLQSLKQKGFLRGEENILITDLSYTWQAAREKA